MGRIFKFKWKTIIVKSKIIGKKNADGVSEKIGQEMTMRIELEKLRTSGHLRVQLLLRLKSYVILFIERVSITDIKIGD